MQTSITQFHGALANGTRQGDGPFEIASKVAESASIPLGYGLVRGTDVDDQVALPSVAITAATFAGFAVLPNTKEKLLTDATGEVSWSQYEQVPVAEFGRFAINCYENWTAGAVVALQHTLAASINPGEIVATAGVNATAINARFENSGTGAAGAPGIAIVHITKQV
jgi:hypothetical protein